MKILAIADEESKYLWDYFEKSKLEGIDLIISCGDLDPRYLSFLATFTSAPVLYVHGNHDEEVFPHYVVYEDIFVTHGNDYHVYSGYDELIEACKENKCHICFHGHTHVPTIQVHEGITFVNPGSAMINRGSYGYGTYAIVDTQPFNIIFYDNLDHHICNQEVLDEGMQLLKEFKKLVKNMK
jgi:putative phosphoesterase